MKIISKYKDYYDSALALGIDKTLVYNRFHQAMKADLLPNYQKFNTTVWETIPDVYYCVPNGGSRFDANEFIDVQYVHIGFCGKIYPCISFARKIEKQTVSRATYYSAETADSYIKKLLVNNPKAEFINEFYVCERPTLEEFEIYFSCPAFHLEYNSWFQEINAPSFLINLIPKTCTNPKELMGTMEKHEQFVVTNPNLKEFEFFKIKDTYTCFQDISQYLGGVLTSREKIKDNLSDLDKVKQHGFDAKYGFRTRPKK
ncbi:MAG: hypothetical protein P1U56_21110 [Saprospiraceae bacterium]|nr:hypothetical protein [Saprospiraceae bacterium]